MFRVVGGGQGELTPHWDQGKKPQNPFKLLINIINIYKDNVRRLSQGPRSNI